jgi:pimeloyl-ACP methyl ester carboxylesterase
MRIDFKVPAGSAALAAEREGEGLGIVYLHAGVCDRRMWRPLSEALSGSPPWCAYDRRGFGETPAVDEARSQVDDLLSVLDHVAGGAGDPRAILVGCSQGGRIALDLALQAPERVRALVLIAPAVSGAPESDALPPAMRVVVDELEGAEREGDLERVNALEVRIWLDGALAPEGRVAADGLRRLLLEMNGIALRAPPMPSLLEPPSAWERLHEVRVPTFVLWGDLDFPELSSRCRALVDRIPGARGEVLGGTAHLPSLEQPERCAALLRGFLASV